jgi:hypothetical protein
MNKKLSFFIFVLIFTKIIFISNKNSAEAKKDSLESFFPQEVLEKYDEYITLEDYEKACNIENMIKSNDEMFVRSKLLNSECIPDCKSLTAVLENGWYEIAKILVTEVYLKQKIDPTSTLYNYYNKEESKLNKLKTLFADIKYETLNPQYSFVNFDNSVKLIMKLPDASFIAEYVSIYCYKDMFKINAIFKSRNKLYKHADQKILYDSIVNDCETNFNSYENHLEISMEKQNKLKIWEKAFK